MRAAVSVEVSYLAKIVRTRGFSHDLLSPPAQHNSIALLSVTLRRHDEPVFPKHPNSVHIFFPESSSGIELPWKGLEKTSSKATYKCYMMHMKGITSTYYRLRGQKFDPTTSCIGAQRNQLWWGNSHLSRHVPRQYNKSRILLWYGDFITCIHTYLDLFASSGCAFHAIATYIKDNT